MQIRQQTRRIAKVGLLGLLGAAALLLASCNSGGVGIFYSLQTEVKTQNKSNLSADLSVASMGFYKGATASSDAYYIGAGTIYTAAANTTNSSGSLSWKAVTAPTAVTNSFSNQLVIDGSTLYAVYIDYSGGTANGVLYEATLSGSNTSPPWKEVTAFSSLNVQSVFLVNDGTTTNVLVSAQETTGTNAGLYDLYRYAGGTATTLLTGLSSPIIGGTYDSSRSLYWFAGGLQSSSTSTTGATLYTGSTLASALSVASIAPTMTAGMSYQGIYYSSTLKALYVSTSSITATDKSNDTVYVLPDGKSSFGGAATWQSTSPTGLGGFGEFIDGTVDTVIVGSDSGYYELSKIDTTNDTVTLIQPGNNTLTNSTTTSTAGSTYVSTKLAAAHVIGFFTDSTDPTYPARFFALTQLGLWRNETGTPARTWAQD